MYTLVIYIHIYICIYIQMHTTCGSETHSGGHDRGSIYLPIAHERACSRLRPTIWHRHSDFVVHCDHVALSRQVAQFTFDESAKFIGNSPSALARERSVRKHSQIFQTCECLIAPSCVSCKFDQVALHKLAPSRRTLEGTWQNSFVGVEQPHLTELIHDGAKALKAQGAAIQIPRFWNGIHLRVFQ